MTLVVEGRRAKWGPALGRKHAGPGWQGAGRPFRTCLTFVWSSSVFNSGVNRGGSDAVI